jgi:N-acyl-D-aspartate/D-glutamate deacylase
MRFEDRGVIKVGAKADLVLFDVAKVRATSSYVEPFKLAEGFDVVVLNGKIARENGVLQPSRHGRVLRSGGCRERKAGETQRCSITSSARGRAAS